MSMKERIYSVGQINSYIKNVFIQDFFLRQVSIKGEVSNCKYHSSGHIYFTLKDGGSALRVVMFAGKRAKGLDFRMQDGDDVIVTGSVEVYERDGTYQLYANKIKRDGLGILYQRFEELKRRLAEMGMFSQEYKQPIPKYVKTVGVVTAPTGAAIQDIRNITSRRNPFVQVLLYPALVQGEGAAESIVRGIQTMAAQHVDVLIVGRGGGSIEDLWAFNEEIVARAIFECPVPVISAVGHETDTTIADYVADLRAPTPSAAAELAVFDVRQFFQQLEGAKEYLARQMMQNIDRARERVSRYQNSLQILNPQYQLREKKRYLADQQERLEQSMKQVMKAKEYQLQLYAQKLDGLSPLKKLQQGYSVATREDGKSITSVAQVKEQERITIHVTDGVIETQVKTIKQQT